MAHENKYQSHFTYQMPATKMIMTKYVDLWNKADSFENSTVNILILLDPNEKRESVEKLMQDVKYKWPNSITERKTVMEALWERRPWNEDVQDKNKKSILIWHNWKKNPQILSSGGCASRKRDLLAVICYKCIEYGFLPLCSLPRKQKEEHMFDFFTGNLLWGLHPFDCIDSPNNYSHWWKINSDEAEALARAEGIAF